MIDATAPFEKQDLTIADLIAREGRAIVFAINKWDLLENKAGAISRMREKLDRLLPQVAGAPLIATSARTGEGIDRLVRRHRRGRQGLEQPRFHRHPEPLPGRGAAAPCHARHQRAAGAHPLHDPAQGARPPSFTLFGNQLDALPEAYLRYLQNGLREAFDLKGTPLRFSVRNSKNPYATKK